MCMSRSLCNDMGFDYLFVLFFFLGSFGVLTEAEKFHHYALKIHGWVVGIFFFGGVLCLSLFFSLVQTELRFRFIIGL